MIPRVGFLSPPAYFDISLSEFLRVAPPHIQAIQTIIPYPGFQYTFDMIADALPLFEPGAATLVEAGAHVVGQVGALFGCAPGMHIAAARAHCEQITTCTGVPFIMMSVAMVDALQQLGCTSVAVTCTYYNRTQIERFLAFLDDAGFTITASANLVSQNLFASQDDVDAVHWEFPASMAFETVRHVADAASGADAVVVAGSGMRMLPHVAAIEAEIGLPIVAADIALYWGMLKVLEGVGSVAEHGRLLANLPA